MIDYLRSEIILHVPFAFQTITITDESEAQEAAERLKFFFSKEGLNVDVQLIKVSQHCEEEEVDL